MNEEEQKKRAMELWDAGYQRHLQNDLEGAIDLYGRSIQTWPTAEAYTFRGWAYERMGRVDEAIAEYRAAIQITPDHAKALCNLGNVQQDQGKLEEAIAAFREAIRLDPDDAISHYNVGNALQVRGKLQEAIAAYRTAIRLRPDFAAAHTNLANALLNQGKHEEAVAEFRATVRLRPDDPDAPGDRLHARGAARERLRRPRPPPVPRSGRAHLRRHVGQGGS